MAREELGKWDMLDSKKKIQGVAINRGSSHERKKKNTRTERDDSR